MTARLAVVDVAELESAIERAVAAALARPVAAPSEWLTSAEAAQVLGVSTKTLGRLRRERGLPAHEPAPGMVRYRRSEIDTWMQQRSGT